MALGMSRPRVFHGDDADNCAYSKFITPWAISNGFEAPILLVMAMLFVFSSCGIIFWFYGKKFRGLTANSFVHRL